MLCDGPGTLGDYSLRDLNKLGRYKLLEWFDLVSKLFVDKPSRIFQVWVGSRCPI